MAIEGISSAVIARLPRYYRYLGELMDNNVERISSNELSKRMKVTASQIRQDLNNFGGFGQQGYGYNVEYLRSEIGKIIGIDTMQNLIIIGAGHLGQALASYDFEHVGFKTTAIFDINPALKDKEIKGVRIRMMDSLESYIKENKVDIVALTAPKRVAKPIAENLEKYGITAIWNFAPLDLMLSDKVVVKNVHLTESLMTLSYEIKNRGKLAPEDDN